MRHLLPLLLLGACSDYNLESNPEPARDSEQDDTDLPPEEEEEEDTDVPEDGEEDPDPEEEEDTDLPADPPATEPVYAHSDTELYRVDLVNGAVHYIGTFHDSAGAVEGWVDLAIDLNGQMYGATWEGLYQVDPTTGFATFVCDPGVGMIGLTFTSAGELVASGSNEIHFIDPVTCQTSPLVVGSQWYNSGDIVGLPDGYLYWTVAASSLDDGLVRVDPTTGDQLYVGDTTGAVELWGLGYHDGLMWGFSVDGHVVTIDPVNAVATHIAQTPNREWWGAATNPVLW